MIANICIETAEQQQVEKLQNSATESASVLLVHVYKVRWYFNLVLYYKKDIMKLDIFFFS